MPKKNKIVDKLKTIPEVEVKEKDVSIILKTLKEEQINA